MPPRGRVGHSDATVEGGFYDRNGWDERAASFRGARAGGRGWRRRGKAGPTACRNPPRTAAPSRMMARACRRGGSLYGRRRASNLLTLYHSTMNGRCPILRSCGVSSGKNGESCVSTGRHDQSFAIPRLKSTKITSIRAQQPSPDFPGPLNGRISTPAQ